MPQPPGTSPAAFSHDAPDAAVGVVVVHGFTGSVAETRPLGAHLAARGHTVRCPLLPGHGTRVEELTRGSYTEWLDAARAALVDVQRRCGRVFVVGTSMGALIALHLAQHTTAGVIAGVVAVSTPVRVQTRLLPLAIIARHLLRFDPGAKKDDSVDRTALDRNWCYDRTPLWGAAEVWRLMRVVRRDLARVSQPLLAVQGRRDTLAHPMAGSALLAAVSSPDKELVWFERSGHTLLLDGERDAVNARITSWIEARATLRA